MNEDNVLIEKFLGGDQEGFNGLVRKYQDRILNIIYSLVGNDNESEDLTQEVFIKIYNGLCSFSGSAQFSTWLYRITVNTVYSFLRRRKEVAREIDLNSVASQAIGPSDKLLMKEKEELIKKAIEKVPVQFKMALILKDIEGLSYKEIAQILKCSIGTVESKIYRARQILKREILKLEGGSI